MECGFCDEDFPLTGDNTMVARFKEEPDYDYVLAECPCGGWNRNFVSDSTIQMLISKGVPSYEERFAPPDVVAAYLEVTGTPLIQAHELTTTEEHLVEYFRWLLERGDQS